MDCSMARPRFYLVLRGARGAAAKQRYLDRLEGLGQGDNVGNGSARPNSIALYVRPFAQTLPSGLYFQQGAFEPSWDALNGLTSITSRTKATLGNDESAIKVRGYKAARLVRRTIDTTGSAATSKLTGLRYLKYDRTSVSAPFGRSGTNDTIAAAFTAMKGQISANTYTVSLIDEQF
jgi:hypothetical protein